MNAKGKINYKATLEHIYDEANDEDKKKIETILGTLFPKNGSAPGHAWTEADKIIKKYRPEYFQP